LCEKVKKHKSMEPELVLAKKQEEQGLADLLSKSHQEAVDTKASMKGMAFEST
jgi:hypothetical protein